MLGTGAHLLRSHRCSGTCYDSGRPLKSMNTFASAHTNSFLCASQYVVPHGEQHCNTSRYTGFVMESLGQHLQQHVALEHALDFLHKQLQTFSFGIRKEKWQ